MSGGLIKTLAAGAAVTDRVMIVAAHPDDETIGIGAQLCRLRDSLLVHVTDGAPRDGQDAARHGFASAAAYATARRGELAAALRVGQASGVRTAVFGLPDQQACRHLADLTRDLVALLRTERPKSLVTHAYEGGHPDHDAVAFAVAAAAAALDAAGQAVPELIEMALYHAAGDHLAAGEFLPGLTLPRTLALAPPDQARKRAMIACFATQSKVLAGFKLEAERLRPAPAYDFTRPPHPGPLHYERLGWGVTGDDWRRYAAAALAALDRC